MITPPALQIPPAAATPLLKGFKAYELDTSCNPVPSYNRLDFYKVSLVTGHIVVQYADRNLELNGTHLFFANPRVPYSTLLLSAKVTGYACLFTEEFMQANGGPADLHQSPLFRPGGLPVCRLSGKQGTYSISMFEKMLMAQSLDYAFKGELVCSYLQVLLHEGLRMQRWENLSRLYPPTSDSAPLFLK
jgi:AraC family transcriptional activator of pobA